MLRSPKNYHLCRTRNENYFCKETLSNMEAYGYIKLLCDTEEGRPTSNLKWNTSEKHLYHVTLQTQFILYYCLLCNSEYYVLYRSIK